MTQRDDSALKVSHDPSESSERQSVTRPISSVRAQEAALPEAQRGAGDISEVVEAIADTRESELDLGRDRPTLMGLAPVELEDEPDCASGSRLTRERTTREPETSTVQPASWLVADAEEHAADGDDHQGVVSGADADGDLDAYDDDAEPEPDDDAHEDDAELAHDESDDESEHDESEHDAELAHDESEDDESEDDESDDDESEHDAELAHDESDDDAELVHDESDDDESEDDAELDDSAAADDEDDALAAQQGALERTVHVVAEVHLEHGEHGEHGALTSSETRAPESAPAAEAHGDQPAKRVESTPAKAQPQASTQVSMFMPTPDHARLPEEGESEWLDLSTRWLVTSGPRANSAQPMADDNEITDAYWAERLSARVAPRADTHSSAPPPPPQTAAPSAQAPGTRHATRATIAYGRPTSRPARPSHGDHGDHGEHRGHVNHDVSEAPGAHGSFDASGQRRWAAAPRRHETLAGISPLPEDPSHWPPTASANDGARASRPSGEPNPWREEPSYSDAPRPQGHGPSTMAAGYAAPAGAIPPWAAPMPQYALQPQAAMMPAYAPTSWNGGVTLPPPWAAQPNYGMHVPPGAAYAPGERRATRTMDYALPPAGSATVSRAARVPQHTANEISFEQWKGMANTWFMTVGKLALAGMALHFSGLAKPLLANFGYAPAQAAAVEPAMRAPVPAVASVAAASVIPEGLSPESGDEPAPRRQPAKREPSVANESTEAPPARRYSHKSAHKSKPKSSAHAKSTRSTASEAVAAPAAAPAAAAPVAAATVASAPQPSAAAPASEEAVGEALLRINSRPWSEIFVDGTHVGHTPKLDLRISAGSHRIRLVNQELGLSKTFEIDAAAGETVSHVELFVD